MATQIDWTPAGPALHRWYTDLSEGSSGWPPPTPDAPSSSDDHRRLARNHWCRRIGATYVTVSRATTNFRNLITLGAPLDLLTGASYVADELTHHLGVLVHLVEPLQPPAAPSVPDQMLRGQPLETSWTRTFEQSLRLYGFNLSISEPIYRAVAATSSDPAVTRLASMLADNLDELTTFGHEALEWMVRQLPEESTDPIRERLPGLLAAYESLCHGDPELLDGVAGQQLAIETDPGNLGSLRDDQLAFIFYDTVTSSILPLIEQLGWDGHQAWQHHYRTRHTPPAAAAAVGVSVP